MPHSDQDLTDLLIDARKGDPDAIDALFVCVYQELRHLARKVRRSRSSETLNTTALVHEAYLKLVHAQAVGCESRLHFYRVAAQAMRQVLVNAAHAHVALKRGGRAPHVAFDDGAHQPTISPEVVVEIDDALTRLARLDARKAQVVECRFFAGLTVEEVADTLDVSPTTVKRDWRAARAWLASSLSAPLSS